MYANDSRGLIFLLLLATASSTPDTCPVKCQCNADLTTVTCSGQTLTDVPSGIPQGVHKLVLDTNDITVITDSSFKGLFNLTFLSLKNNYIVSIDEGSFDDQGMLKDLYLTHNKLANAELHKNSFRGLGQLQHLYLGENSLIRIPDVVHMSSLIGIVLDYNQIENNTFPRGFASVDKLQTITLSNNKLTSLRSDDFAHLKVGWVTYLGLSRNQIKDVDLGIFQNFASLTSLSVSYNQMTVSSLTNVIVSLKGTQLKSLKLDSMIAYQLPSGFFTSLSQLPLQDLTMAHSSTWVIQNGTFLGLSKLQFLDLSYSGMHVFPAGAFAGLDTLQRLLLDNNKLEKVPDDLPPSLKILDLSHNFDLKTLVEGSFIHMNSLTNLTLSHCNIMTINKNGVLVGLSNLVSLDLSVNQIAGTNIPTDFFEPVHQLRSLNLARNQMSIMKTGSIFSQCTSLLELDMSENKCEVLPEHIFSGLSSLQGLYLHENKLGGLLASHTSQGIFQDLVNLTALTLHDNDINHLPRIAFKGLNSLETLYLDRNSISNWEQGTFSTLPNIKAIDLASNQISLINQTSLQDMRNGTELDLTSNPFACWCDLIWFRNYMRLPNVTFVNQDHYMCNSPQEYAGKPLLSFSPEDIESDCKRPPLILIVGVAVGSGLALFLFISGMVYRYRWRLRRYHYNFKRKRRLRAFHAGAKDYERLDGEETMYDFCILYHENQINWVKDPLVTRVVEGEGRGGNTMNWKVFFEDGEVEPNKTSLSSVAEAIYQSRRSILVLTREFLQSSKCTTYLMHLAFLNAEERKLGVDGVILIMLDDKVAVHARQDKVLLPIIDQDKDLIWPPDGDIGAEDGIQTFWEKLEDQLNIVPVPLDVQTPV